MLANTTTSTLPNCLGLKKAPPPQGLWLRRSGTTFEYHFPIATFRKRLSLKGTGYERQFEAVTPSLSKSKTDHVFRTTAAGIKCGHFC
jgi:hypothetical protein